MFEQFTQDQITAVKALVQGAELIAAATGKPVTEVVNLHLPAPRPDPQARGLALVAGARAERTA